MEAWKAIDGQFLFTLAAGIATAIIGLAAVLDWLLTHYPFTAVGHLLWVGSGERIVIGSR